MLSIEQYERLSFRSDYIDIGDISAKHVAGRHSKADHCLWRFPRWNGTACGTGESIAG